MNFQPPADYDSFKNKTIYKVSLEHILELIDLAQADNNLDTQTLLNWLKLKPGFIGEVKFSQLMLKRGDEFINKIKGPDIRLFLLTYYNDIGQDETAKYLIFLICYFISLQRYTELLSIKPVLTSDQIADIFNEIKTKLIGGR